MALYRERGVNPAAGCLPLLLQMPIWFALFSVLRSFATDNPLRWIREGSALFTHIEQGRQLDFLWMDLSITPSEAVNIDGLVRALPYLITILIVMGTAYWQQRQTMARNPQQDAPAPGQALLKIFPVFFGFISFTLPAGLVVYFAASQIFRIGQQALILGMDGKGKDEDGSEREEAPPGKQAPPAKESRAPKEKPQAPAPRPKTQRPQGSKKRRGKRRRRK